MATAGFVHVEGTCEIRRREVDHLTYYRVIERLARIDASVGWLVAISNEGAAAAGYLPVPAAACIPGSGGVGYVTKPMSRASAH